MEIRRLTANGAPEWWRLRLESLECEPEAFSASLRDHRKLSLEEVQKRLGVGSEDAFVIGTFERESLTGMAGFYREPGEKNRHKGRIWGVYVTPKLRGAGLGRSLLQTVIDTARLRFHCGDVRSRSALMTLFAVVMERPQRRAVLFVGLRLAC